MKKFAVLIGIALVLVSAGCYGVNYIPGFGCSPTGLFSELEIGALIVGAALLVYGLVKH
jgi:hypothetical protein